LLFMEHQAFARKTLWFNAIKRLAADGDRGLYKGLLRRQRCPNAVRKPVLSVTYAASNMP
jgi:hypothetical protein